MEGRIARLTVAGVVLAFAGRSASAVTREVANVPAFRLTFGDSVLNQLTYDTYRTAYDELQTRPYNLLFAGIGRHANLSPWPGQEGGYARYVDALIGNNGAANVDNNADAIQGTMIRRQTGKIAWGVSKGVSPADASATKVFGTEFATEAYRLLMECFGEDAYIKGDSPSAVAKGRVERAMRGALILTFGGGTNEIQRDIIAMAGLRMPRSLR